MTSETIIIIRRRSDFSDFREDLVTDVFEVFAFQLSSSRDRVRVIHVFASSSVAGDGPTFDLILIEIISQIIEFLIFISFSKSVFKISFLHQFFKIDLIYDSNHFSIDLIYE